MSIISVISLVVSIAGVVLYSSLFAGSGLGILFIIISLVSVILPPIAKKVRITQNKRGKTLEIIAIVVGGFNFYSIIFALTALPAIIGFLGWLICGVIYSKIG